MKPCQHTPPVPTCRICRLAAEDSPRGDRYRALWAGLPVPEANRPALPEKPRQSLPCIHLGGVTKRLNCNCSGRWTYQCKLPEYGSCVPNDRYSVCPGYIPDPDDSP